MLNTLVAIVLGNAVVATLFALGVVLLARWYHKPALLHGLWVVVLLKLVTPPMFTIPVPMDALGFAAVPFENPPETTASLQPTEIAHDAEPRAALESALESRRTIVIETPLEIVSSGDITDPAVQSTPIVSGRDHSDAGEASIFASADENDRIAQAASPIPAETQSSGFPATTPGGTASEAAGSSLTWRDLIWAFLWIWGIGALLVFLAAWRQILRFEHSLRTAEPAGDVLNEWVHRLASRMGLRQTPAVYLLEGTVSPMLWGFGRKPRLLFPRELLARLNDDATETLILHELAHMRRGDHWVRVLELACQCLYWWHPLVWWGRKQLRIVEEECCDAFVVEHCGGGVYAHALLTTVDFLSNRKLALPPGASGMSHLDFLKRRLTMIMQGGVSARLAGLPKYLVLTAAVVCLSILPRFVAKTAQAAFQEPAEAESTAAEPVTEVEVKPTTISAPRANPNTILIGQEPIEFEKTPKGYPSAQLEVRDLNFSPDGKLLAAGYGKWDTTGEIVVYNFAEKKVIKKFPVARGVASSIFSPDGKFLASSYWNNHLEIRDTETWDLLVERTLATKVTRLAFSPDGKYLAACGEDGFLSLLTVGDWEKERPITGELFRFQKVAFSSDGKLLAAVGGSFSEPRFGRGLVFEVETGKQLAKIETDGAVMASAAFSPDGKELATGEYGTALRFWEPTTGKPLTAIQIGGTMDSLEYTSDGRLVGPSFSGQVHVIKDRKVLRNLSGHDGRSLTARMFPDGKTLVSGGIDSLIRIWNPDTGVPIGTLRPHEALEDGAEAVLALTHSPDGRYLASTHEDGSTRIRDAVTGEFLRLIKGHEDVVAAVAFSPDSQTLATGSYDQTVKLWNVETGEPIRELTGHSNWVFSVAFSPDGKTLASGGYDKTIRLWDVKTGKSEAVLEGHAAAVRSLAYSADGKNIASGSSDRTVRVWDVESKKSLQELEGHTAAVRAVAFAPEGTRIASGSEDNTIRFWNAETGELQQELKGHTGMVWTLAFSPRGRTLASGGFDNTLRIWNAKTGAALQTLSGHQDVITSLSYSPNTSSLITGSYDKTMKLWPAVEPPIPALADLKIGDESDSPHVRFVAFSPDGTRMITGNQNRGLRLWDLKTGRVQKTVYQPRGITYGVISADGKRLATGGYGGSSYLYDAETLELLDTFEIDQSENISVALSPDGKLLAGGTWEGAIVIWDVQAKTKLQELPKQAMPVGGLAFSPDGKLLVTATGNYKESTKAGTVKLWDTKTWQEVADLLGPKQKMRSARFSPDGKTLVAHGSQHELLVYDVQSRKLIDKINFGTEVASVAFLADSRTVVMGGYDGRVELWSLASKTRLVRYDGHQPANQSHRYIFDVAVSPDASVAVSAGGDGHVKLWPTSSLPPIEPFLISSKPGTEAFHVVMTPDGSRFAVARTDKTIAVHETKTGKVLTLIENLNTPCAGLAFAPDGKSIAGAMIDGRAYIWDAETGEEMFSAEAHTGGARRVAFSPDGKMLATGGWDETAAVWNVDDGTLKYRIPKQGLAVSDVKFSPEGKLLITSTGSFREWQKPGTISVWDADDGSYFRKIENHGGEIKGVALNPGGRYLVSFGGGGARVWNRVDSKPVNTLGSGTTITAAVFSPDGQTLFAGHASGAVLAYDVKTGQVNRTLEGHEALVHGAAISADGTLLVTSSKDGTVKLWPAAKIPAIPLVQQIHDDQQETFALAYSPERELIAVGGKDKTISLFDAKTKKVLRELTGHNGMVFRMAFMPGGKELFSGSSDGTARLWDVETGEQIAKWTAHGDNLSDVRSVAVSADGKRLAAGNWEGETFVWDLDTQKSIQLTKQSLPVTGIAFAPDGQLIATSTGNWKATQTPGELSLWDPKTGKLIAKLEGHTAEIKGVVFDQSGETLISHSTDNTIRFWDMATKKQIRRHDHDRNVNAVAIHGNLVAFGDFQGGICLLDLKQGGVLMRTGGHYVQLAGAAFAADGSEFYTVALDGFFKTWSTRMPELAARRTSSGTPAESAPLAEMIRDWQPLVLGDQGPAQMTRVKILNPHGEKVWFAVYSPDGKTLATGGSDKTVKLWNAETMELLQTLSGHGSFTTHAAFSPDGKKVATVSWRSNGNLKLWNVQTGKLLATSDVHKETCRQVAFSPDGQFIATVSEDHFVRVFNSELAMVLSMDAGLNAYSVAFSPDSQTIAVGTGNLGEKKEGHILLYDTQTGKKVKELENSDGYVFHLQFLKDGKRLLAANGGAGCAIWNTETGEMEELYRSVEDTRWVEIDRDEKRLIATARVGEVFLWNRYISAPVVSLKASEKFIHCATFSPDGRHIVVADEAGALTIWEMTSAKQTQVAKSDDSAEK